MEIVWITLLVFVLYARTLNYHYMIDDIVRRWGYLYDVPTVSPPYSFYNSKPSKWRHLFPIITHALNVIIINQLWGWKVALIFAVHPLSVPATAWITGGYYSVTALLTLTAYYFIHNYHLIGGLLGSVFYTAALGSTITCIGFPFLFFFQDHIGLICFWPLLTYLFGKRFLTGLAIRSQGRGDKIDFRKLAVAPKVVAYYILMGLVPNQLSFFRQFGFGYAPNSKMKKDVDAFNFEFYLSCVLILAFAVAGWTINPFATLWFFGMIAPFCQFKQLGQFVAERYSYLPNVGIAILLATVVGSNPILLTILVTLFVYRSHLYIPAYRHMEDLYLDGIRNYPQCVTNYANIAEVYLQSGRQLMAYQMLEKGLAIDPDCFLLHCNIAAYWIGVNNLERGLLHTKKAIALHANQGDMAYNVMHKQQWDVEKIIAERNKEYERLDKEKASQEEYDNVKSQAAEKAKDLLKERYALVN